LKSLSAVKYDSDIAILRVFCLSVSIMSQFEFINANLGLKPEHKGCVATIGAFDGVHMGHMCLIEKLKQAAKRLRLPSAVLVFEPLPNEFFSGKLAPARLMRLREKVIALKDAGVDRVVCFRFDSTMRSYTAQRFLKEVLHDKLGVKYLVVGDDFRFGCDRKGDFAYLKSQEDHYDFQVVDTKTLVSGQERVSSTYIRQLLSENKLDEVASILGRPYRNIGRVSYGKQLGRTLGFPTLNIGLGRIVCPLSGVFVVNTYVDGECFPSIANIGVRPSVNQLVKPVLEVHVFDQDFDLYGKCVEVEYLKNLRAEKKFNSVDELKAQIALDISEARNFFKSL
jgi:riboflavin kinase/FMN adenylyltransferase